MPVPGRPTFTAIALAAIAIVSATFVAAPRFEYLRGPSLDAATALRWRMFGQAQDAASSPTVVVALDEETYRTPPFKGTPTIAWTGEIARVLRAVLDGGVKVVGFDVIFPTTIEDFEIAFGAGTIGERMRGFDRDFLRALSAGASEGKLVLGAIRTGDALILPAAGQRAAVGFMRNIRFLNVYSDFDGVVRRIPLIVSVDGRAAPAMALELALRALGSQPEVTSGGIEIAGNVISSLVPNAMTLNFDGGSGDIPTYSLADLLACADKGDKEFFRRNFAGKIVLFGSKLDLEDLKLTSKRFASTRQAPATESCVLSASTASQPAHGLISGVFVQATAVNNLMRGEAITELGDGPRWLVALAGAAIEFAAALNLTPVGVALSFLLLCGATAAASAIALHFLVAAPVVEVCLAGLIAVIGTTVFRLFVTDKDKHALRRNFELYLAPAVVERIANSDKPPQLGGEQREVTIFFSDLVKFSTLSETMSPHNVVDLMNRYLTAMTDVIEAHGGFIDKYIGDAILAVFGAPLDDACHAERAVRAALACCERLRGAQRGKPRRGEAHARPSHRTEFRRGRRREYRLEAAVQLHRHGRCGEPRVATSRAQIETSAPRSSRPRRQPGSRGQRFSGASWTSSGSRDARNPSAFSSRWPSRAAQPRSRSSARRTTARVSRCGAPATSWRPRRNSRGSRTQTRRPRSCSSAPGRWRRRRARNIGIPCPPWSEGARGKRDLASRLARPSASRQHAVMGPQATFRFAPDLRGENAAIRRRWPPRARRT